MIWQLGKIFGFKRWLELLLKNLSVRDTNTTTNYRTDVTNNCLTNFIGQLRHKLVS